jgi:hypothetical protein
MHAKSNSVIKLAFMAIVLQSGIQLCRGATPLDAMGESKVIGNLCAYQCYEPNAVPCDPEFTPAASTCPPVTPAPGTYGIPEYVEIVTGEVCQDPPPQPVAVITFTNKNDACQTAIYSSKSCIGPTITLKDSCAQINLYNCNSHIDYTENAGVNLFGAYDIWTASCTCTTVPNENNPFVSGSTKFGGSGDPCD